MQNKHKGIKIVKALGEKKHSNSKGESLNPFIVYRSEKSLTE